MLLIAFISVTSVLGFPAGSFAGEACPTPTSVRIVSRVGSDGLADERPKYAKTGEVVTLFAVVEAVVDGAPHLFADPMALSAQPPTVEAWPVECPIELTWFKVEAGPEYYWQGGKSPPAQIAYFEVMWLSGWAVVADVHPKWMHDEFTSVSHGYGVMRYKVVAQAGGVAVASPGKECREQGSACRAIHRVAYRKDDTYLGYLLELFNTPYIYGSGKIPGGHQTDLLVGSDCSDFVVYGKRRQYPDKPKTYWYASTGMLHRFPVEPLQVVLQDDGTYVTKKGRQPIPFGEGKDIEPGDLFNMPGHHVGALSADNGNGILDWEDLILHTLMAEPRTVSLRDCDWDVSTGTVLRWKE